MGDADGDREDRRRGAHARIRDVASAAGVSPTTVSHALSGTRPVGSATRAQVIDAAAALGYSPNMLAVGLRHGHSGRIALVGDAIGRSFPMGRIVEGAQRAARSRGLPLVVSAANDESEFTRTLHTLAGHRIEGVIIASSVHRLTARPDVLGELPAVLVNASPSPDWNPPSIAPDEEEVARVAANHLLQAGHRRIAFASSAEPTRASIRRERGFQSALNDAGIDTARRLVERCSPDAAGGRTAGTRLLSTVDRPTGVFCFNDQIAMGVYQAASVLRLRVPEDCSIIGVDDLTVVSEALIPTLTTVTVPYDEMGYTAANTLFARMDRPNSCRPTACETVAVRLTRRGSVAELDQNRS